MLTAAPQTETTKPKKNQSLGQEFKWSFSGCSSYDAKGEGGEAATPEKSVCWDPGSKGQLQTRCVSPFSIRYSPSLPLCLTWLMHMGELQVPRLICLSTVLHQSLACLEVSRKKDMGGHSSNKEDDKNVHETARGWIWRRRHTERACHSLFMFCKIPCNSEKLPKNMQLSTWNITKTLSNDSTTISNICMSFILEVLIISPAAKSVCLWHTFHYLACLLYLHAQYMTAQETYIAVAHHCESV